jgi:hypothetical protein
MSNTSEAKHMTLNQDRQMADLAMGHGDFKKFTQRVCWYLSKPEISDGYSLRNALSLRIIARI